MADLVYLLGMDTLQLSWTLFFFLHSTATLPAFMCFFLLSKFKLCNLKLESIHLIAHPEEWQRN